MVCNHYFNDVLLHTIALLENKEDPKKWDDESEKNNNHVCVHFHSTKIKLPGAKKIVKWTVGKKKIGSFFRESDR